MSTRRLLPLQRHVQRLSECRRCGHLEDVLPIVSEAVAPRVMLVGQAPGKTEVADRRPFAGRAGRTLFRWLANCELDEATVRREIYIAAITRCYPGPSPSGRGDRVPSPHEREECAEWLAAELRLIRPGLIIPVGRMAVDRFLGPLPLDEVVGRVHDIEHAGGRSRAVPLPHPSGASSWTNVASNRVLLETALRLLGRELRRLGVGSGKPDTRRVACY